MTGDEQAMAGRECYNLKMSAEGLNGNVNWQFHDHSVLNSLWRCQVTCTMRATNV